ncbi:MAG: TolC family protein [Candidatus Nitrotoga sp.]
MLPFTSHEYNIPHMQRQKAGTFPLCLEGVILFWLIFLWSHSAAGAIDPLDPFRTKRDLSDGRFGINDQAKICSRDRMHLPLTLSDVVELTLCNNPKTRLQWASARQQAAQVGISRSAYLPTFFGPIAAGGLKSSTRTSQQSITVSVNYLLYDFGGRAATLEAAQHQLATANALRDDVLRSTFLTAIRSYYAYMAALASMQAFKVTEVTASTGLAAATARVQAGAATQFEILQAKTALSQARLNRIRAEGDATSAKGELANVMGFYASQSFELAPIEPETSLDSAVEHDVKIEEHIGKMIEEARKNRPDLFAAEAQIKVAESQLEVARASSKPTFTLTGGVTHSRDPELVDNGFTQSLRVTISVPWFSGFRDVYRISAGQAVLEGKIAERDQVSNQIALDVWKAYQLLLTNSHALRAASDLYASAQLSEKLALGRYKSGIGSILDVLTVQGVLATAGQQKVGALYNFKVSKLLLAQTMGILDLSLVEEKNPAAKLLTEPVTRIVPPSEVSDTDVTGGKVPGQKLLDSKKPSGAEPLEVPTILNSTTKINSSVRPNSATILTSPEVPQSPEVSNPPAVLNK